MSSDFLAGYGGDGRTSPPRTTPPGWQPGSNRAMVPALVCPVCGSLDVRVRDNGRTLSAVRIECAACAYSWRESPGPLTKGLVLKS